MAVNPIQFPTGPMLQPDGKSLTHQWQRFFQDLWRKTGQASNTAPISIDGNSQNIDGILSALHIVANAQLNTTNFCTVDSVNNGTDTTIRVYGSGGPGTTWTRKVSNVILGPYPSLSQAGFAYSTVWEVLFNPTTSLFVVTQDFSQTTDDDLIWCGEVKTVDAAGAGGSTGGGGTTGTQPGAPYSKGQKLGL